MASCSTHLPDLVASGQNCHGFLAGGASPGRPSKTPWTCHASRGGGRAACDPLGPVLAAHDRKVALAVCRTSPRPRCSSPQLSEDQGAILRRHARCPKLAICQDLRRQGSFRFDVAASDLAQLEPRLRPGTPDTPVAHPTTGKRRSIFLSECLVLYSPGLAWPSPFGNVQPRFDRDPRAVAEARPRVHEPEDVASEDFPHYVLSVGAPRSLCNHGLPILDELFVNGGAAPAGPKANVRLAIVSRTRVSGVLNHNRAHRAVVKSTVPKMNGDFAAKRSTTSTGLPHSIPIPVRLDRTGIRSGCHLSYFGGVGTSEPAVAMAV